MAGQSPSKPTFSSSDERPPVTMNLRASRLASSGFAPLGFAPSGIALISAGWLLASLCFGCHRSGIEETPGGNQADPSSVTQTRRPLPTTATFELDGTIRSLRAEERHIYPIELGADVYVELWAEQLGIDVVATVQRPEGGTLELDSPTGKVGAERLVFITKVSGQFRFEVRAFEDQATGSYRAELRAQRPPTAADRRRAEAAECFRQGQQAVWDQQSERAEQAFQAALDGWGEGPEDGWWKVETLDRLGRLAASLRQARSIPLHAEAASLAAQSRSFEQEAINRFLLGRELRRSGELEEARRELERALELYLAQDDAYGQALTYDELGDALQDLGELQQALEAFERARELWRAQGYKDHEASILNDLSHLAMDLGRLDRARDLLQEADTIWRSLDQGSERAYTLDLLGQVEQDAGRLPEARRHLETALELYRDSDAQGRATTLANLAQVVGSEGDRAQARDLYRQALDIFVELRDRRSAGHAWNNLASLASAEGLYDESLDAARQALEIFQDIGLAAGEAEAQHQMAKALRGLGRLHEAREHLASAVSAFEALRGNARSPTRRAYFFAELQNRYDRYIDLLMELASEDPRWAVSAFEVHERRRARVLLDLLSTPRGNHGEVTGSELKDTESKDTESKDTESKDTESKDTESKDTVPRDSIPAIQRQINQLQQQRAQAPEARRPELERRLRELTDRLAELRARRLPSTVAEPLDAEAIRRTVLDDTVLSDTVLSETVLDDTVLSDTVLSETVLDDTVLDQETVLLAYALGRSRGFLWLIDRRGLVLTAELPPADELDGHIGSAYRALALRPRREGRRQRRAALCQASDILLGPVAELLSGPLAGRRLAIMADGPLERLAFGALPFPTGSTSRAGADETTGSDEEACADSFLIESHELVHLPSASITHALRRRRAEAAEPRPSALVVADPIFGRGDPRLGSRGQQSTGEGRHTLQRLPHTGREAEIVLRNAELTGRPGHAFVGSDATKVNLLGDGAGVYGGLHAFETLHFATHGVLDPDFPELSALALSHPDGRARAGAGYLFAHEIQGLELNARLVVLSACETALGRELRGEGLLGLTRAFFQAGADRLLVSLWNVDDAAGAELMERFYRHLWQENLAPAAALRAAQLDLLADPQRRAPYFWAGFVVQGDWR